LSVDFGGSWLLPRLIGLHKAKELAFFADVISASDAERLGLVNRVVPPDQLDAFVDDWAAKLAGGPPMARC
jgi:2-(1,2-epoxy-1,2-dihydrophenyl)acetyl-CoA isomerase